MKIQTKELSRSRQATLLLVLSAVAVMLPDMAFAVSVINSDVGNMMCSIAGAFTGSAGRGLSSVAIITIGVGALMGKVTWGMAITVCLGITLIFGASTIVNSLGSGTSSTIIKGCS